MANHHRPLLYRITMAIARFERRTLYLTIFFIGACTLITLYMFTILYAADDAVDIRALSDSPLPGTFINNITATNSTTSTYIFRALSRRIYQYRSLRTHSALDRLDLWFQIGSVPTTTFDYRAFIQLVQPGVSENYLQSLPNTKPYVASIRIFAYLLMFSMASSFLIPLLIISFSSNSSKIAHHLAYVTQLLFQIVTVFLSIIMPALKKYLYSKIQSPEVYTASAGFPLYWLVAGSNITLLLANIAVPFYDQFSFERKEKKRLDVIRNANRIPRMEQA